MSGGAVVIIIGGGTEQNRSTEDVPETIIKVKLTTGGSAADQLRAAADILDGSA
jgi:hypothetical protein